MKRRCSETATSASTLFPVLWCALGFIESANLWQAFFSVFWTRIAWTGQIFTHWRQARISMRIGNSAVTFPARSPRESRWPFPLRIMRRRPNGGASSASPRISSPVVPLQHVQFALVRPVLSAVDVTVTYWIVRYVLPFLCVRFGSAQLPVPKVALPDWNIRTIRPRACDMISPELNPLP